MHSVCLVDRYSIEKVNYKLICPQVLEAKWLPKSWRAMIDFSDDDEKEDNKFSDRPADEKVADIDSFPNTVKLSE